MILDWIPWGYNTRLVASAAGFLGAAAGAVGAFALLRSRALLSDALGHAAWPGVALAFLLIHALDVGRALNFPILMTGAVLSAIAGVAFLHWLKDRAGMREDGAIAAVLGYFYAFGIVLFSHIQTLEGASQIGVSSLLLGSAALISSGEAVMITVIAVLVILLSLLFFKELSVLCFQPNYLESRARKRLDMLLSALIIAIAVIGMQTVGLVLIVAVIIIPASAARLCRQRLLPMFLLSICFGAVSAVTGVILSARWQDIPTGGAIVLTAFSLFFLCALFSPRRGIWRWLWRSSST